MTLQNKLVVTYLIGLVVLAAILVICVVDFSHAEDERCQQLRQLRAEYAGRVLTAEQKMFKVRAIAWYRWNCERRAER